MIRSVLLLVLLFALAGCLPVSKNPLSTPEDSMADARLPGVWYGRSGEDTIFLHFVAGKGAAMDAVEVDHQKNGDAHTNLYTVLPAVIGKGHYLSVRDKGGAEKPYTLARYHIAANGEMTLWLMSEKPAARAVKNEDIAGKITPKTGINGKPDRDITLTASTEELAAFVRSSEPDVLFGEKFATFKKLVLPDLPADTDEAAASPTPKKSKAVHRRKKSED